MVDTIKRGNTTEILFPDLHAGDAIFYNYTVEHGVAPCESGTRVSIVALYAYSCTYVRATLSFQLLLNEKLSSLTMATVLHGGK